MIDYECTNGDWQYCENHDAEIIIKDLDGNPQVIARHEVTEAKKVLGIYDSPSGDSPKHFEIIDEKFEKWINRMKNGHLQRRGMGSILHGDSKIAERVFL